MAHEITIRQDGKAEMAFASGTEAPWHFNDTNAAEVPADAPVSAWIVAAGMDWQVCAAPVIYDVDGDLVPFGDRYVLYRSDSGDALGIVSGDYNVLQPAECLEFFDDLVRASGLRIDTAGTLFGGKRFWALASVGEDAVVDDRDRIKGYVLLSSSADGTRATECRHTAIRVVCANTLSMSDRFDAAGQIRVTHRSEWDATQVKQRMGLAPQQFHAFMEKMRRLADFGMSDDSARKQVRKVLGKPADGTADGKTFERTMDLFRGAAAGSELGGVDGTAWGLLNAFTETLDHKSAAKSDSHRFQNAFMGPAEVTKIRFRDQLLALVD